MGKNIVKNKSFDFALEIIQLSRKLAEEEKEFVISKQIMRSGTAVGALIREAEHAESKKDFIHKMSIALKEASETEYWLELLRYSDLINQEVFNPLANDLKEILRLLIAIIKKTKENLNK